MAAVTLQTLVKHLQRRGSPLAAESALFVTLECAEAFEKDGHRALVMSAVRIDSEGVVVLTDASKCDEREAVRSLGHIAQQLCANLPPPSLALAKRIASGDIATVSDVRIALEAQLVPLNRGAARRIVARLIRDALKDAEAAVQVPSDPPKGAETSDVGGATTSSDPLESLGAKLAVSIDPLSTVVSESAVDTAPDGAPVASAVESAPDNTPLPSRLPPPPRLGSLSSMQIGSLSSNDDREGPSSDVDSDVADNAGQTVQDQEVLESSGALKKRRSPQGPMLAASLLLFVFAGLFFAWRLMHR